MTDNEGSAFDVLEDVIRYETAVAFLRPLAEGLALFAEFDITPFPYLSIFSTPLQWVYMLFTRPSMDELRERLGFSLYKLLWDMRLSDAYIRHKANLLIQPLSCREGGYLPGYMTVKQLWCFAASRTETFAETDLFLSFLQSYIYNDYGFVSVLFDETVAEVDASNAVAEYFQRRMGNLVNLNLRAEASQFQRYVQDLKHGHRPDDTLRIATSVESHSLGKIRLDAAIKELDVDGAPQSVTDLLKGIHKTVLAQRDTMCLGSSDVSVRSPRAGWIEAWIGEDMLIDGAACEGTKEFEGAGSLDVYVSLSGWYRVACVSIGPRVVLLQFFGDVDETLRNQFEGYVVDRRQADVYNEAERALVSAFIEQQYVSPIYKHVQEYLNDGPQQFYKTYCLVHVPEADVDRYFDLMQSDGLLPLLGGDPLRIRALALASLCASLGMKGENVSEEFARRGLDFARYSAEFENVRNTHNVPLLLIGDDTFLSAV
jgi:hypothetical protein